MLDDLRGIDNFRTPVVVLHDSGKRGIVVSLGAHVSTIIYEDAGHKFTVQVPNEDFTITDYINFWYEEQ